MILTWVSKGITTIEKMKDRIRHILKEEVGKNFKDNLYNFAKEDITIAIDMVGSFDMLVEVLKLEKNQVDKLIENYIDKNFYPDYDIGFNLHDFYREEVIKYGSYEFTINDENAYAYYLWESSKSTYVYKLWVYGDTTVKLSDLFGEEWIPVFKKWFEKNTGLIVKKMITYRRGKMATITF